MLTVIRKSFAGLSWYTLLSVYCFIGGACTQALAEDSCIIVVTSTWLAKDYTNTEPPDVSDGYFTVAVSGFDHTGAPQIISKQLGSFVRGEKYYNTASSKYYWNSRWRSIQSAGGFYWTTETENKFWVSVADYVMYLDDPSSIPHGTHPRELYPNGCSDVPPPCPDSYASTAFISNCPELKGSYDCATNTGKCDPDPCEFASDNDNDGFNQCADCDDANGTITNQCISRGKSDIPQGSGCP